MTAGRTVDRSPGVRPGSGSGRNPGWNQAAQPLAAFTDARELQRRLRDSGVTLLSEADESTTGPASFTIRDPDGNMILIDQHR